MLPERVLQHVTRAGELAGLGRYDEAIVIGNNPGGLGDSLDDGALCMSQGGGI